MYAMIRRYSRGAGTMDDLMRTVETRFAGQISGESEASAVRVPGGIEGYYAIAADDGTVVTITLFLTEEHAAAAQVGARDIRLALAEFQVEELDTVSGEVRIAKAAGDR